MRIRSDAVLGSFARRHIMKQLWVLAGLLSAAVQLTPASADVYPSRPLKWIVPYAPGGATDATARIISARMTKTLGQPIIIENRPGAGGNLGTEAAINSAPDGYTLLFVGTANAINASLYRNLRFDFARDVTLVAALGRVPIVMEVNPAVPATSVSEFITYAKAHPGELTYASSGIGNSLHLTAELFKSMAGVDLMHVPYRGSAPALADLISGQVQVMFDGVASSLEQIRAGKLRPLAVTTTSRIDSLPAVPTLSETIPGFEAASFFGVGVPRATPPEIVALLNRAINEALNDASVRKRLSDLGIIPTPGPSSDFDKALAAETEKWAKVIRDGGIRAD